MFCRNCGKEINPTHTFCPSCGAKADNTPIQYAASSANNYSVQTNQPSFSQNRNDDPIVKHITCRRLGLHKAVPLLISGFTLVHMGITLKDIDYDFEPFGMFFIIFGIVVCTSSIYFYMLYEKRFCEVRMNSIKGVTFGGFDFVNEEFEFNFDDVSSAWKNGLTQVITVETKYSKEIKLYLPREDRNYVYELLKQHATEQYPPC